KVIEFTRLEINPDSLKRTYNRAEKKLGSVMSEEQNCLPLRKVFAALKMSGFLIAHDGDKSSFDADVERFVSHANLSKSHVEKIKSDIEAMMRPNREPETPA
ncbi:hypothetical protein ACGTN6_21020, partial [Halomonas sp. THAF12]|uniref:hypothetical protein n=1 Tax=Halomonas sp. B23F22_10 TaxID=3459515 RepID=UPI00373FAC47